MLHAQSIYVSSDLHFLPRRRPPLPPPQGMMFTSKETHPLCDGPSVNVKYLIVEHGTRMLECPGSVLSLSVTLLTESPIQSSALQELPFLPFMVLLEVLRKSPFPIQAGRDLRCQLGSVGVVAHLLHCLTIAGHHTPRARKEKDQTNSSTTSVGLETKRCACPLYLCHQLSLTVLHYMWKRVLHKQCSCHWDLHVDSCVVENNVSFCLLNK